MKLFEYILPRHKYQSEHFVGTEAEVNRWAISDFILDKIVPIVGTRPYPLAELEMLVSIVIWYHPTHVCDWGTHYGKATRIFYETVKAFQLNSKVVSIDLPENVEHVEHPHANRGKFVKNIAEVKLLLGDGATTALKYLSKYSRKNMRPLFFLDGDHAYKSIKRELRLIHRSYPRAVIVIHDTFYQSADSGYNIGPYQAVQEFLKKNTGYQKICTTLGLPGMTTILPSNEK